MEERSFLPFVAIVRMLNILCKNQCDKVLKYHANNLSRLILKMFDINEQINNMSSSCTAFLCSRSLSSAGVSSFVYPESFTH